MRSCEVLIVGAGPAGLTTAIYTGRSGRDTIVLEKEVPGGLVATTDEIENYPGFLNIGGAELSQQFVQHAQQFGAEIISDAAESIREDGDHHVIVGKKDTYRARAVVIASGSAPRKLNVPGEERLVGSGVSYCATCDGAFFEGREVACVGGGDAAVGEAAYLTRFANRVHLIHRRDQLRAVQAVQERVMNNDNVDFVWNTVVEEIIGDAMVEGLKLRDVKTDETRILPVDGVFIYIGHRPATEFVEGEVDLTEQGEVITDSEMQTSVPGVFAVGDVRPRIQKQIATSVGDGATAGMSIEHYLSD